jgi:hypothetical protein
VKLFAGSSEYGFRYSSQLVLNHGFLGIKDFLEDLNPQLLNTITTEFDKVEGNPAPEPTRTSADLANMAAAWSAPGKSKAVVILWMIISSSGPRRIAQGHDHSGGWKE